MLNHEVPVLSLSISVALTMLVNLIDLLFFSPAPGVSGADVPARRLVARP